MNTLRRLEENERSLADLYKIYSENFPDLAEFWKGLSNEEAHHSEILQKALKDNELEALIENKIPPEALLYVENFIKEETTKAKQGKLTHADALNTALRLERSFADSQHFDIFVSKDTRVLELFRQLDFETDGHVHMLEEE